MKIQPYNYYLNTPCNISMNGYFVIDLFSQIHIHFCQLMTLLGMSTQQCISLGKIRNLLTNFCIVFLWNDNLIPVLQKTIPSLTGQMTSLLFKKKEKYQIWSFNDCPNLKGQDQTTNKIFECPGFSSKYWLTSISTCISIEAKYCIIHCSKNL